MKVCYWNVLNTSGLDNITAGCERLQDEKGIDVFCLQEVPYLPGSSKTPASLAIADKLGMDQAFEYTRDLPSTGRLRGYGTAILSASGLVQVRSEVLRTDQFAYMSPGEGSRRVLMTATTEQNPEVQIGVAHLSNKLPLGIGRVGLAVERQNLVASLSTLKESSEVVFGGDLNCPPTSTLDAELADVGFKPVDAGDVTFRNRFWPAGYVHQQNFDRAFISEGLEAEVELGDYGASDHRAVIVNVA